MKIEGVWTAEVYGPFGWENIGIMVLEKGRIIGGGNRHYSAGSYALDGKDFKAKIDVTYYGPPRTLFGETAEEFCNVIKGKLSKDVIEATIKRPDKSHYDLRVRLTRRMDVPPHKKK